MEDLLILLFDYNEPPRERVNEKFVFYGSTEDFQTLKLQAAGQSYLLKPFITDKVRQKGKYKRIKVRESVEQISFW
jgi:hypothetical protein